MNSKERKGFTLIELLVVIAIIAILSAIVITSLSSSKDKANKAAAKQTIQNVSRQIEIAATEGGNISPPSDPVNGGGPICTNCTSTATWPSIAKTGYSYNVPSNNNANDSFEITLTKENKPTISASFSGGSVAIAERPSSGSVGGGGGNKSFSGNITYANASNTQLNNITVILKQNGATMYTTTTSSSGNADFIFSAVAPGTYDVYFSIINESTKCSVTATDALLIKLFTVGSVTFEGVKILAADIYQNSPNSIITTSEEPSSDSYMLQDFLVGIVTSLPTGRAVFTETQYKNTAYSSFPIPFANSGGFSNITVTIDGSDVVKNFTSLQYGDVNASCGFPIY